MGVRPVALLANVLDYLRPPPRHVDWSIFAIVVFEAASGLLTFTVGTPAGWPLYRAHRIAGLALVVLLGLKLARVGGRLVDRATWRVSTALSVLTLFVALAALGTGMLWTSGLDVRLSHWTLLSVHVGMGLALVPLVIWHLSTRFALPARGSIDRRRTALRYGLLLVGGAAVYRGQELANHLLDGPGADRRFTGSQPRREVGNDGFPVTAWVADDPDPIDVEGWSLEVTGSVEMPLEFSYDELPVGTEREAVLDCTSGWYTLQRWRGVRVGELLATTGVQEGASHVRFVSVTGYRWSLPIDEARNALLATHVGGEALSHGHGAPLRLVAPGRRGFQWVKWVARVEVRR